MKRPWQSRTTWAALVMAILGFIPGFEDLVQAHPQLSLLISAVVMFVMRLVTKEPIQLGR